MEGTGRNDLLSADVTNGSRAVTEFAARVKNGLVKSRRAAREAGQLESQERAPSGRRSPCFHFSYFVRERSWSRAHHHGRIYSFDSDQSCCTSSTEEPFSARFSVHT